MSNKKKTTFVKVSGAVASYYVPLHVVRGVEVAAADVKTQSQKLVESGAWLETDAKGHAVWKHSVPSPAAVAAQMAADAEETPAAFRLKAWLMDALKWIECAEAPDWTGDTCTKLMDTWDSLLNDSQLAELGVDWKAYSYILAFAHQNRIDMRARLEKQRETQKQKEIKERIAADLVAGKLTWVCKCTPGEYNDTYLGGSTCSECWQNHFEKDDIEVDGDFRTLVLTDERLAEEMKRRRDGEDKAPADHCHGEEEDPTGKFRCIGSRSSAVPHQYRHGMDGDRSFGSMMGNKLLPPVIQKGARWLADARARVFEEGDKLYRWQLIVRAMSSYDTKIVQDQMGEKVDERGSEYHIRHYSAVTEKNVQWKACDPCEQSVSGPEDVTRLILSGDVYTMPLSELKALELTAISASQIFAVAQKFREHHELMVHEHAHATQLMVLLAAILIAARPSERVKSAVSDVLYHSVPPLDPRCDRTRYHKRYWAYNRFYELFFCGAIVR
jgi:hypothetical protein